MTSIQDQYDSAFLGILQNEGNIVSFLDVCFSFLARRTDFFVRMKTPNDKMGFSEGVAEKLVLKAFRKYERLTTPQKVDPKPVPTQENTEPHEVKSVVVQEQSVNPEKLPDKTDHNVAVEKKAAVVSSSPKDNASSKDTTGEHNNVSDSDNHKENNASGDNSSVQSSDKKEKKAEAEFVSSQSQSEEEKQPAYQANPDSYNGAIRDGYSWSQSITDVDLKVWVPNHILKGKDVFVDIKRKHIVVGYKAASGDKQILVDSDLTWDVHKDECLWSLEPGKCVTINLEKVQERWWEAVITNEPKINVQKIDPSRPMTDLDDEAQAKIEEMMYNDRQKKLGLPQSHEQKVHDMLKQGWDAEGSPFRGQPFDPSKLNIAPNSMN